MSEAHAPRRVVTLRSALLSVAEVQQVASELGDERGAAIDCESVRAVTLDGLSALLALGERSRTLALTGLSRELMKVAVEARLANVFAIYRDRAAYERASASHDLERSDALQVESA